MSESHVLRKEEDGVLELVFNRPEKYNAITFEIFAALAAAAEDLRDSSDLRVLLIRATGKYFSAGFDISTLKTPEFNGSMSHFRRHYRKAAAHDTFDAFESVEKPVIVAHQGTCLGGALEMSLSCDFRVAGRGARYGLPEVDMGMIPGSGGTSRLVRAIGPHWARWLIMTGQQVDAQWALNAGLIHQLYEDDELEAKAWEFARLLAKKPPEAIAMAKVAIDLANDTDRAHGRLVERVVNSALMFGKEREEMMAALLERMNKNKK